MRYLKFFCSVLFVLAANCASAQYDLTVAADGSGNYTTVQAAVNAAPLGLTTPYKIFIKNGKYREKLNIPSGKTFIQFIGESVANTILYYDDAAQFAGGTSGSASITISANDFSAFNITFANTYDYDAGVAAGVSGTQGVAVLINGDRSAFKNCRFLGNQDTLYENKKGYFRDCYIDGIIDFIFGGGAAVFEGCTIYPKTRTTGGSSYITAPNTSAGQAYGYLFRDSKFIGNPGNTSYVLGRTWQNSTGAAMPFAENKAVLVNSVLNSNISAAGWAVWDAGTNTSLITFAEYQSKYFNNNPVDVSSRISWSQQLNAGQAATYSNANVLGGWDPCTVYPGICNAAPSEIAVSNFIGTKGVGTATFKWNLSWGIDQVKFELFRSLIRNGSYTKIGEVTSPNDTTYNYNYIDNTFPPGQQVYYYLLASKAGSASHGTDTLLVSSKPTITATSSLGTFQQGGFQPSASQTYTVNGVNLSDNIIITPPANYEISLNNTSWTTSAGSITLTPASGIVPNTTLYVRQNAGTAPGTFSGNIVHTTINGDNVNVAVNGTSQVAPLTPAAFFRSRATGNLNDVATWETSADSTTWFAASTFPLGNAEENVTIMPGHTLTVNVAHIVNGKWTVFGNAASAGGAIVIGSSPGALSFANNSLLNWNRDGGTLPATTVFSAGSTFAITGTGNGNATSSVVPSITAGTAFHHVIINAPNIKTNNPNLAGTMNTINGNLTVYSTGYYGAKLRFVNGATQVVNIAGDLIINPPIGSHATFVLYSSGTSATSESVTVNGNVVVNNAYPTNITGTSGTFATASTAVTLSSANPSIVPGMGVTGAGISANTNVISVSGTNLVLSTNTSAAGSAVALTFIQATASLALTDNSGLNSQANFKGNLTFNNAVINASTTGIGTMNINRTDGVPQMFSRTAGSFTSTIVINVLPNAVFDAGTSALQGGTFNLNAGATLRSANPAGITASIISTNKIFSSAANYVFNGTAAQSTLNNFSNTTPTINTVANLTINNSANVTLGNSLAVTGALTLTAGKLLLGANSISANSATGSATGYAATTGTGTLKINNVGTTPALFPVGPSTGYNPVTISNSGTVDNFSVRVAAGVLPPGIDVSPRSDSSVNNTWTITEDVNGGSNTNITLQWKTSDQNSLFNGNNAAVVHSDGTAIDVTGFYGAATNLGGGVYSRTGNGFTSFSPFGVNSRPNTVVAASLLSFTAKKIDASAGLSWRTTNEINMSRFEAERSTDKIEFEKIGTVQATGTAGLHEYQLADNAALKGYVYYRLKIIETNGSFRYSNLVRIDFADTKELFVSPNPAKDVVRIDHEAAAAGAKITIYGPDGRAAGEWAVAKGTVQSTVNLTIPAGTYFIVYSNNGILKRSLLVKQ